VTDRPIRLCIVSRERLRSGAFIAALQTSFGPEQDVQVIADRRHVGLSGGPVLKEDRRRQPQVDLELEANGFAIVPVSVEPTGERASLVPLFPFERLPPADSEDDERLASMRSFRHRWSGPVVLRLIGVLIGVTLTAFALSLAGQFIGHNPITVRSTGPLPSDKDQPSGQTSQRVISAQLPTVTQQSSAPENRPGLAETPPATRASDKSSSAGATANTKSASPRDADQLTPGRRETNGPSKGTDSAPREPSSATLRSSTKAGAPSDQVASAPLPAAKSQAAPLFLGKHRAELVRGPVSQGWGDSYTVRLLDPAGRPMVVLVVSLMARMADGAVENIAMGALPERGTYRATVPTGRSTPVDLRVRVNTGERFVEIPVSQ
jgi:hypothetical protein